MHRPTAATVVVMPGSPALVTELAPQDSAGARLADAVRAEVDRAGDQRRPLELVGSRDERWRTGRTGTLAAWGAPQVEVEEGNYLPELVQRAVLGERARRVRACRSSISPLAPDAVTVVAVDGSAGLTRRAPLSLIDDAAHIDAWCRSALAGGAQGSPSADADTGGAPVREAPREARLADRLTSAGVLEPGLWLELAELPIIDAQLVDSDTSTGVGRYVARLQVALDGADDPEVHR